MKVMEEMQHKPPYAMIAILFVGAFIAFLNNTLLNVALPTIMIEFDVKPVVVQWLTTGYMLVNGILIPASAFFVQRFSNRKLFITAMVLFTVGTLLAALAPVFGVLIAARMIQAAGSAMMMPLLMNVMLSAFPIERRGAAMGMFGLVMILAPAIGPSLSGFILEHAEWRALFEVILPFAVIVLLFAIFKLRNITPNSKVKLDVFSLILSSIGFGSLLYGFSTAGDKGWGAPIVYGTIIIGFIALVLFVWRQLTLEEPMLDVRIYKYPMFTLSSIISIVVSAAMFSGMILTPLYVQTIRGISPFHSGLLMLPGALAMAIMSPITGKIFDKYGARILAITGLTITAIATHYMSEFTQDTSYYYIMGIYTLRMFGMSMVMMPIMTNGLNQLPMNMNPHGTAMNNTLQQVSGAIGSAIFLTIMNARMETSAERLAGEAAAAGNMPTTQEGLAQFKIDLGMKAMLEGINHTFFIATLVTVVALVLSLFVKRVKVGKAS
ncbi:DHA2 family efflux MFS transporter permease subunit [Psychrobacillus sp. NEAU-3TGS]|uniref:DHA2 family efflux MFS transporter permease subunit n=1 Tax=Psychrobacillus sp. NEAU-3TGS TaxID=2995412 RepID=UPI002495BD61|nr:DHA2 family efflux MFS transporter permease subunit [Psychrobacillus sp. NEAU-3TGS]MDI2589045.1 DHA2 family efflux MFS transporter permease subunit [Psychrobacillus sp. NEAU-3TGS]